MDLTSCAQGNELELDQSGAAMANAMMRPLTDGSGSMEVQRKREFRLQKNRFAFTFMLLPHSLIPLVYLHQRGIPAISCKPLQYPLVSFSGRVA